VEPLSDTMAAAEAYLRVVGKATPLRLRRDGFSRATMDALVRRGLATVEWRERRDGRPAFPVYRPREEEA
jgi:predicted ArsR family transcriptional regulator